MRDTEGAVEDMGRLGATRYGRSGLVMRYIWRTTRCASAASHAWTLALMRSIGRRNGSVRGQVGGCEAMT